MGVAINRPPNLLDAHGRELARKLQEQEEIDARARFCHARPQRIAIGPSVPLVTFPVGTTNTNRRRARQGGGTQMARAQVTSVELSTCRQLGLDPAAFAAFAARKKARENSVVSVNTANIHRNLGIDSSEDDELFEAVYRTGRAALKSTDAELRQHGARLLMALGGD
jgi:hypothetical protein